MRSLGMACGCTLSQAPEDHEAGHTHSPAPLLRCYARSDPVTLTPVSSHWQAQPPLNPLQHLLLELLLDCRLLELLERKVGGRPALVVDGVLLTGSSSVSAEEVIVPRLVELRLGFGRIPGLVCVSLELLRKLALHCLLAGVPVLVQLAPCPDPHICRPLPGPARLVECRSSLRLQVHGPVVERRRVAAVVTHHPHGGLGGVNSS